ncbi:unnamed protein product, partial [Cyprideis torosa]
ITGRTPKTLLVRETRASDASALEWSSLGPEIGLAFLGELARSSHSSDRIGDELRRLYWFVRHTLRTPQLRVGVPSAQRLVWRAGEILPQ